jgi:anti-anti-sigma regulatory factor
MEIILRKPHKVVMDLSKVPTMGSLGIGKILMFFKSLRESNSASVIIGIHENSKNVTHAKAGRQKFLKRLDSKFPRV